MSYGKRTYISGYVIAGGIAVCPHPTYSEERHEWVQKYFKHIASQYDINSWERDFLTSIKLQSSLTAKQEVTLRQIEQKVFPATPDTDTPELF